MSEFRKFVGLRISTQPGAVPTAAQIDEGELAFNVADRRIFARFGTHIDDITDSYTQAEIDDALSGKANTEDLKAVATSGSYNDLDDTPTLGTAAAQNTDAFDTAGSANNAVNAHTEVDDPHTQYVKKETGKGLSAEDYTTPEKDKLEAVGSMANRDVYISDQPPDDAIGSDGDIWLQHWS
ncbi:hypothetical protein CUU95_18475 [Vreelandella alkaliphila]|uniref:hypothetical protein n=1 Tax=Vreelandella alkaliphila TaxID=272774 RepID=UPI000EA2CBBC|nr:hypothetical protein [Halomonas alkaliphila]AYF35618.1 hypothetical protein CUU95_18155 [Halomonas alkaliphila]AYF35677.1 hypothetical protein CUU95_18475 [Halomonas alkaliphila]